MTFASRSPEDRLVAFVEACGGSVRESGERIVCRCPAHDDTSPSLSVRPGRDGGVLIKCFAGCKTIDVLEAVGFSWADVCAPRPGIRRACSRQATFRSARRRVPAGPDPEVEAIYGGEPSSIMQAVWDAARDTLHDDFAITDNDEAYAFLQRRGLGEAITLDVLGIIGPHLELPTPLTSWYLRAYRIISPLYDVSDGTLRSIQARAVIDGRTPKTMNPSRVQISGTCFANERGLGLLRGEEVSPVVVLGEGLTDFWALSIALSSIPVLSGPGVGSAANCAARWARGRTILCAFDNDAAGDRGVQAFVDAAHKFGCEAVGRVEWPHAANDACDLAVECGIAGLREFLMSHLEVASWKSPVVAE
jgi:hypothetical protein